MQLHPGVLRDHDPRGRRRCAGPTSATTSRCRPSTCAALRPLLEAFGHHPGLRLVLFTVDEDTFSRELAPIAGVYPAVRLGAPWWFLDTPDGMRRFREAVTDTAGFANTTGFVDDTRAFCSIPARHDLARRVDAGFLARLVAEHRLDLDEAIETAVDLAYRIPRQAYAPPQHGKRFPAESAGPSTVRRSTSERHPGAPRSAPAGPGRRHRRRGPRGRAGAGPGRRWPAGRRGHVPDRRPRRTRSARWPRGATSWSARARC